MNRWQRLKEQVRAGYRQLDAHNLRWAGDFGQGGGRLYCQRGCRNCCRLAVHATFTEALCVADALTAAQRLAVAEHAAQAAAVAQVAGDLKGWLRGYRQEIGRCPLLAPDGACGVYAERPFACRALWSTRPADWCGVDLATLHPLEKQAFLSSLDRAVVAWPTHYAEAPQEAGRAAEEETLWRLRELFGFSVTGNLPYLLWLEQEIGLSTLMVQGRGAVEKVLVERKLQVPY
ncbi:MAG: YkgJ family cysteine cluster protein, partial [Desulfuromonadales bacterium]|nr:YkgJ family cysteine cluster protein [Desulfuromonadales bacterium]